MVNQLLVSIVEFFGFGGTVANNKKPLLVVYRDESNLKNAMLTIRMALNPGEAFNAEVAARIRREAAAYEEFLRNPRKVGWIVLYEKKFEGPGSHKCVSREQLRIREPLEGFTDPEEGSASFGYSFVRSSDKVLEFMVHDENDKPLFPLVRTYTNWAVYKELDLGMNRKFYLTLDERVPGYVNLQAGFSPQSVKQTVLDVVPERQQAAAACATGNVFSLSGSSCHRLSPRQPATAIVYGVITLIMLLSGLFVAHQVNTPNAQAEPQTNSAQAHNSGPATVVGERGLLIPEPKIETGYAGAVYSPASFQALPVPVPVKKTETLKRLADVRRFRVSVDRKSCEGRCLKLLDGIQRQLKSRLDGLNLPPAAPDLVAVSKPSATLVVSYLPLDDESGNIHLALSDHEGSLWNTDQYFEHAADPNTQISDARITDQYSEQFSTEVLLAVFRAKDQCLSEADKNSTTKEQTK